MTEQEAREAEERADMIIKKVRTLVDLEDAVLAARDAVQNLSTNNVSRTSEREELMKLESQLKSSVEELNNITEELKWETPCFRAYVLPQMSELVGTLKACDTTDRKHLAELVTALTDEENSQSPEQLAEAIVTRIRINIERTFGANA